VNKDYHKMNMFRKSLRSKALSGRGRKSCGFYQKCSYISRTVRHKDKVTRNP